MVTTPTATRPSPRTATIIRQALATYRTNFARVAIAAFVVLVPLDVLEAVTAVQVDTANGISGPAIGGRILLGAMAGIAASFGAMSFGGLLDRLVAGLVTAPMIGMALLEDGLDALLQGQNPLVSALVVNGLNAATLGALVGLLEVLLTDALVTDEHAAAATEE